MSKSREQICKQHPWGGDDTHCNKQGNSIVSRQHYSGLYPRFICPTSNILLDCCIYIPISGLFFFFNSLFSSLIYTYSMQSNDEMFIPSLDLISESNGPIPQLLFQSQLMSLYIFAKNNSPLVLSPPPSSPPGQAVLNSLREPLKLNLGRTLKNWFQC